MSEFASDAEINKMPGLVKAFIENILYDEEPVFISDEATIWDVSMSSTEVLIRRCSEHYGINLSVDDLSMPLWKLIRKLNDKDYTA
jgi:hypothetical protein